MKQVRFRVKEDTFTFLKNDIGFDYIDQYIENMIVRDMEQRNHEKENIQPK